MEKSVDAFARAAECRCPLVEQAPAFNRQLVGAFGGPRLAGLPARSDEAVLLEAPQHAVEIPHVDTRLARDVGQRFQQLVAVRRPLEQQQEQGRLAEPLHAGADPPVTGTNHAPATGAAAAARPHGLPTCKRHMYWRL